MKFNFSLKNAIPLMLITGVILYTSGGLTNDQSNLKPVDKSKTCMASNMYADKEGIKFSHDGKKYYGCSEMCIKNLELNAIYRYGTDPVSGKLVDKALSLVAANEAGKLFYFENEETFKAFR